VQSELECLREDHLVTLRREVEARIAALKSQEQGNDLRVLRLKIVHLEADLAGTKAALEAREGELAHQKDVTQKALLAVQSPSELSSIISEMAKFRGEASRLEIENMASQRRFELLEAYANTAAEEAVESRARVQELQEREESASTVASDARRASAAIESEYIGGLKAVEAGTLKAALETARRELEAAQHGCVRYKELSEISSLQAQTIGAFKQEHLDELSNLREYCSKLESQGDDELLIGKLQRQLMSTKTSYKAFARKYQFLRGNMQQRELAMRVLETRLDEREAAVLSIQDTHRLEIAALKKSLRTLRDISAEEVGGMEAAGKGKGKGKKGKGGVMDVRRRINTGLESIGDRLLLVSEKVNALSIMAEGAVAKASSAEEEKMELQGLTQDLSAEKDLLLQRCSDLEAVTKGQGTNKQNALATRLVALSEDVRTHKLATLQQRREIQILRQEKKHLQNVLATMEADVEDLEEGKVRAETKNLLMDLTQDPQDDDDDAPGVRGGMPALGDTIQEYKRLRGGLVSLSNMEEEEGYEERKASSAPSRGTETGTGTGARREYTGPGHDDEAGGNIAYGDIPPDELIQKMQAMNDALSASRREAGENRLRGDRLQGSLHECEAALREMERHVTYYEGIMVREGLPDIKGNQRAGEGSGLGSVRRPKSGLTVEDQEHLQEAATATMASMKQLLEEKNRAIDKYREKLEDAKTEKKPKSAADRKADALLERLTQDAELGGRSRGTEGRDQGQVQGQIAQGDRIFEAQSRLLEQIEQADAILMDKDRTIGQLEQRLLSQENQRERAEIRCGSALKEMDAMKQDMILLAQQLQASERKYTMQVQRQIPERPITGTGATGYPPVHPASQGERDRDMDRGRDRDRDSDGDDSVNVERKSDRDGDRGQGRDSEKGQTLNPLGTLAPTLPGRQDAKILDLQKTVKAKNEKIKGYRDIIVRLKEEFIKLEEDKAVSAIVQKDKAVKSKMNERDSEGGGKREEGTMGEQAMKDLRTQVSALRDGLRMAKEDLEKARQTREKLNSARQAAQEEVRGESRILRYEIN
jgi:hypothetical protein